MNAPFYFDIVCPYAYMAFTVVKRAGAFLDQRLSLKPILLGGLLKEMGVAPDPNRTLSPSRFEFLRKDIMRQAEYFGVPIQFHTRHPVSTVSAMRLITACDDDKRVSLAERLYQDYWQLNRDIDADDYIASLKTEFLISDADFNHAKDKLREATTDAFHARVFGVPTIMINGKRFFGADRLELLQQELKLDLSEKPWRACEPIDFYFDFSSPYSYLAYGEVKQAMKAGASFTFKPILLGGLFKAIGTNDIPMLSAHPNKAAFYLEDMQDWARYRGMPFIFNARFPLRTVTPLRIALCDPRTIDPIFQAAWADNLDIGDEAILRKILERAGFGQDLFDRCQEDAIKENLKKNTTEAITRGVFGVPTFFVRDHKVFGQDRFLWIRRAI